MQKDVCICSVIETENFFDYRFVAKKVCESLGLTPHLNNEDVGQTQAEFEKILREKNPIVILLMGKKSSDIVNKECQIAKSNGFKILGFLKTNSNGTIPKEVKENVITISKTLFNKDCTKFRNCEELYDSLHERLTNTISIPNSVDVSFTADNTYRVTGELIETAKNRILFFQNTSSLILGPRRNNNIEEEYYNKLINRLKMEEEKIDFTHVFSWEKTKKEINENQSEYSNIKKAKKNLELLLKNNNISDRITIKSDESFHPNAIIDNNIILDFMVGNKKCFTILRDNITIHKQVIDMVEALSCIGEIIFPKNNDSSRDIFSIYAEVK